MVTILLLAIYGGCTQKMIILEDFIMAQIMFKACSHWVPVNRVSRETVETFNEVTRRLRQIECEGPYLSQLLYKLKNNLEKENSALWLKKNREELRRSVYLMSELDLLSTDSKKVCIEKLRISAKLIEVIES